MKKINELAIEFSKSRSEDVKEEIFQLLDDKMRGISSKKLKRIDDDFIQELFIEAWNSLDGFDWELGVPFIKYCNHRLSMIAKNYLRENEWYRGNLSRREAIKIAKLRRVADPSKSNIEEVAKLEGRINRLTYSNEYTDNAIADFDFNDIDLYDLEEYVLTGLEFRIVEYLMDGYSVNDIAKKTDINKRTVLNYTYRIKDKILEYIK